jgi:hypothetical protein
MKFDSARRKAAVPSSRWLAYATAGLATAAVTAPVAEAEIHYFSPVHLHLKGRGGSEAWRLPLTGGASLTFYRFRESAPAGNTYFSDVIQVSRNAVVRAIRDWDNVLYAANLRAQSNVSGGAFLSTFLGLIGPRGQFVSRGIGFVGFKFDIGHGVQYGWVRLRTNKGGDRTDAHVTVLDYAFADPGEPILAGQKEESNDVTRPPAEESLGALALGAAGLCAWRRRRASREK